MAEAPTRDTIDDTLDWLNERKESCSRLAMRNTGAEREHWLDEAAKFAHAISLIRREYRPNR